MNTILIIIFLLVVLSLPTVYLYKRYMPVIKNNYKFLIGFYEVQKNRDVYKVSFKEPLNNTRLPMIRMKIGDKSYNFIVDTGADFCIIDSNVFASDIDGKIDYKYGKDTTFETISGESTVVKTAELTTNIQENKIKAMFHISDLSYMIGVFKNDYGTELHGLLGSDFFNKARWVIDFEEQAIWMKKDLKN